MREEEGLSRLYFFTAIETLKNVLRWIDRYKIKNPIQYIFETGDEGYDEVQNALHEIQKHPELRAGITCKASLVRIKLPRFNSKRRGCGLMNVINTQQPNMSRTAR